MGLSRLFEIMREIFAFTNGYHNCHTTRYPDARIIANLSILRTLFWRMLASVCLMI